jgi:thiol-disulfide isomerase/thioredoxin
LVPLSPRVLFPLLVLGAALPAAAASRTPIADRIRGRHVAAEHPSMEAPTVRPGSSAAHMREDDVVLGVVVSGEPRAYPWWIVKHFHVVNDTVAGVPVAVAFCEQCTGAAAFRRRLDGRLLSMDVPGVYNGTIILRDRETRTLWAPFSGQALEGPLAGKRLDRIPLSLTRWREWKVRHPDTGVLWGPEQARGGHGSWYEPGKWGIVAEMGATIEGWDPRLPENTLVYGVRVDGASSKAYPLAAVTAARVVNDRLGEVPVVVAAVGALEVAGFDRRARGRVLTFSPSSEGGALMRDDETGTDWSLDGRALRGPLRGETLRAIDGYVVEWHVWSAYNPRAALMDAPTPAGRGPDAPVFPALRLVPLSGSEPETIRLAGDVNLVALWASWCAPCRAEMPVLQGLWRENAGRGLSVVGIAIQMPDDPPGLDDARRVLAETGATFPNLVVDERAYDQLEALARGLGRTGLVLPTVFVVDRQGRVRGVFSGDEAAGLPAAVRGYLAHPPPIPPP